VRAAFTFGGRVVTAFCRVRDVPEDVGVDDGRLPPLARVTREGFFTPALVGRFVLSFRGPLWLAGESGFPFSPKVAI
jgi:hypothetical protein